MNQKKKKSSHEQQQFEFCEVCRLNHNHGRRHNFFPSLKNSLHNLLTRFQSKLSDVKFFVKTPMRIRPELAHQNRLYCVFCNCDILELDSQFAWSVISNNAVEHLASEEHWKRVKGFMWKYGGGMDSVDSFRITQVDHAKWEKKCKSLRVEAAKTQSVGPLNNIHNEHNASSNKNCFDSLNACVPNYVVPLHSYTNERTPLSSSILPTSSDTGPSSHNISRGSQVQDAQYLKNATGCIHNQHCSNSFERECLSSDCCNTGSVYSGASIGNGETSPDLVKVEGNVHTGAPPPWFDQTKGDIDPTRRPEANEAVTSRVGKSKLNPKRVGAAWAERRKLELEMERRGEQVNDSFDANWLPNFGGVWQSGTRKDSRIKFQMENKATHQEADNQSKELMQLQPYINKRLRKDSNE